MFGDPIAFYKKINTFERENGMDLTVKASGVVSYQMTILDKHLSSPNTCHGGVVASLMDATIGAAAMSVSLKNSFLVSTVEFKINYFKPVVLGDELITEGVVDFEGKKLITSTGEIRDKKTGELVAKAIGTFNKYPLSKKLDAIKSTLNL